MCVYIFHVLKREKNMFIFKLLLLTTLTSLITCDVNTNQTKHENDSTICNSTITKLNKEVVVNIDEYCKTKTCIVKCCPEGEILTMAKKSTKCQKTSDPVDYKMFRIYNNNIEKDIVRSEKMLADYNLVFNKKFDPSNRSNTCIERPGITRRYSKHLYLLMNGSLKRELPNYYERWVATWDPLEYCVDIIKFHPKTGPATLEPGYIVLAWEEQSQTTVDNIDIITQFSKYSLLVSCFFFVLILLVYSLLPQLRTIAGMILMAYVASLLVSFTLKVLNEFFFYLISSKICQIITPITYFTVLSSFFWLNIMSFDIWWTFRGSRKQRKIHRRGETVKFLWYCLYAWGVPALITIGAVMVDHADLLHWPSFVKPHFESCLASRYETILYLYIPLFIIIVSNCILFIMTTYNIWIVERKIIDFNNSDGASNNNNNRNRFRVYKTLSVIMGVSWVLELVHMFRNDTNSVALYISIDLYNSLIGVVIFFLVVFKKKTLIMLYDRFGIKKYSFQNQSSTSNSKYSFSSRKPGSVKTNDITETTTMV